MPQEIGFQFFSFDFFYFWNNYHNYGNLWEVGPKPLQLMTIPTNAKYYLKDSKLNKNLMFVIFCCL